MPSKTSQLPGTPTKIGEYPIAHRIAVGGMAELFRAQVPQAVGGDRALVIKRLLPHLLEHAECVRMFEEEARLGRHVRHENVVELIDGGIADGSPFLVLEYVFGVDLWALGRHLASRRETLRPSVALYVATEMLAGLSAVHEAEDEGGQPLQIVHRDVSPSNVFLSVHGEVKLGDLGIAKATLSRHGAGATPKAKGRGKIGYVAPEVVAGRPLDPRSDLFSAAVVIVELLMGRSLFGRATELGTLLAIRDGDLGAFTEYARGLPYSLAEALRTALSPQPEDRMSSVRELYEQLIPFSSEPPPRSAQELGSLVMSAMDSERYQEGPVDRASMASTVEARPEDLLPLRASLRAEPRLPAAEYRVRMRDLGSEIVPDLPLTYSAVLRGLASQKIEADAEVSINGGPYRAIDDSPELSPHLLPSSRRPALDRLRLGRTTEAYDLARLPPVRVVAGALARRLSGLFRFERGEDRKELYVQDGHPVFVASNRHDELLGESLVQAGLIDREELRRVLEDMPLHGGRLGDTVVALGLVDPVYLLQHLTAQARARLVDLLGWTEGRAAYYDAISAPSRGFRLHRDSWALLEETVERAAPARSPRAAGERLRARPLETTLELSARLTQIWASCEPPRAASELRAAGVSGAALQLLVALGALEWVA